MPPRFTDAFADKLRAALVDPDPSFPFRVGSDTDRRRRFPYVEVRPVGLRPSARADGDTDYMGYEATVYWSPTDTPPDQAALVGYMTLTNRRARQFAIIDSAWEPTTDLSFDTGRPRRAAATDTASAEFVGVYGAVMVVSNPDAAIGQ